MQHRDPVGDDADDQRGARAVEEAGEEVAAEQVGAEQKCAARRQRRAFERQPVEDLLVRAVGRDQRRGERHCDDGQDHGKAEQGRLALQYLPQHPHQPAPASVLAPAR